MKKFNVNKALSEFTKPEHPVLVISGNCDTNMNIMVAGWVMRVSFNPPLIAVSVGHTRYTHELLVKYPEFVLAYPVKSHKEIINYCGSKSGKDFDKFKELKIKTISAEKLNLLLIEDARINFECKTITSFAAGDHTVFVGEVVSASGNPDKNPLLNIGNYVYKEFSK